ncbi:MAG: type II toxin-antitoxin system RatA family toxin [Candidatus Obscuribacterales bacterium]|nr:type II toxin-antitoxin system RatA family toxin [Steroidobacteraceae bacterium]
MRELTRTALVSFSPAQMFALVDDIARYPEFLPWLTAATELKRTETERVGRLTISRAGLSEEITTRNIVQSPTRLAMQLIEGPFNVLEGTWTFAAIDDDQGIARGTRIKLEVRFEFKSRLTELLLGRVFESSCDTLVDAFTRRAQQIYSRA